MPDDRTQALARLARLREAHGLPAEDREALTRAIAALRAEPPAHVSDAGELTLGIASAAAEATGDAFARAQKRGRAVLIADGGALFEVQPDGTRRRVGATQSPPGAPRPSGHEA